LLAQKAHLGNKELLVQILKLVDEEQKMLMSFGDGLNK
jgi:hypothetical protein